MAIEVQKGSDGRLIFDGLKQKRRLASRRFCLGSQTDRRGAKRNHFAMRVPRSEVSTIDLQILESQGTYVSDGSPPGHKSLPACS